MKYSRLGQTALEYLLLLAIVGVVVMLMFKSDKGLPQMQQASNQYFSSVQRVIYGENPTPINGGWCGIDGRPLFKDGKARTEQCPKNLACGQFTISRRCECPAPAFGGKHCMDDEILNDYAYFDAMKECQSKIPTKCTLCPNGATDDYCNAPEPVKCGDITYGRYVCDGTVCSKGVPLNECTTQNCTGPEPKNGTLCTALGPPVRMPWKMVSGKDSCNNQEYGGACTKYCDTNKGETIAENNDCVKVTCIGNQPPNTTPCGNRDKPLLSPEEWDIVAECDPDSNCELTCASTAQYKDNGQEKPATCEAYECTGAQPEGTECPNTKAVVGKNKEWISVTECTQRHCEVLVCPNGLNEDKTKCK